MMNATTIPGARTTRGQGQSVPKRNADRERARRNEKGDGAGDRQAARRKRFALQRRAGELLPGERVAGCCRRPHASTVDLVYHPRHGTASLAGLQTCGSVWACPVCASKISERRRLELSGAVSAAREKGFQVLHVIFTIRHHWADSLGEALDGLLRARRRLLSSRWAQRFRERHGVVGRVRALEVTFGRNGWHPHVHELVFVDRTVDAAAFLAELREAWSRCLQGAGLRGVNAHGVELRVADLAIADYVAKFGRERSWGTEHEIAKQVVKRGRGGSVTPVQLLERSGRDAMSGVLWVQYARAFKGRRQLVWSAGLRDLLGLAPEQTDEEIAAAETPGGELVVQLQRSQWKLVVGNDARGELLDAVERGGAAGVALLLESLGGPARKGCSRHER